MPRPARLLTPLLACLLAGSTARAEPLEVGVAAVEITPPTGYRMAGYYAERLNTGTRDPLMARAIAFRQGKERAVLVFCDLVAIPQEVGDRARAAVAAATGVPAAHVAVAATHSHTGPLYHGVLRTLLHDRAVAAKGNDPAETVDYSASLVGKVADAAVAAVRGLKEAGVRAGFVREDGVSFNRRFHMKDGSVRFNPGPLNPEIVRVAGPIDPEAGVVLVGPPGGGKLTAGLTVFALHLDTVGGTEYSADYPFFLEDELRKTFGAGFVSLFGAGTCGDINHIDVSTRERLKTETIGRTLARAVAARADALPALKDPSLGVAAATVELPLQTYQPEDLDKARKVLSGLGTVPTPFLETVQAAKVVELADFYRKPTTRLEVQAFRLGADVALVTLPGEVFVEHGLAIKKASPFRTTLVIELANSCPAYVPTRKAFGEGSYEVVNSRLAPGGGEKLVATALDLLQRLHAPPNP